MDSKFELRLRSLVLLRYLLLLLQQSNIVTKDTSRDKSVSTLRSKLRHYADSSYPFVCGHGGQDLNRAQIPAPRLQPTRKVVRGVTPMGGRGERHTPYDEKGKFSVISQKCLLFWCDSTERKHAVHVV